MFRLFVKRNENSPEVLKRVNGKLSMYIEGKIALSLYTNRIQRILGSFYTISKLLICACRGDDYGDDT